MFSMKKQSYRHECAFQGHTYIRLNAGSLLPAASRKPVEAHGGRGQGAGAGQGAVYRHGL